MLFVRLVPPPLLVVVVVGGGIGLLAKLAGVSVLEAT